MHPKEQAKIHHAPNPPPGLISIHSPNLRPNNPDCRNPQKRDLLLDRLRRRRHRLPQQQFLPDFTSVEQDIWTGDQVVAFGKVFHAQCMLAPVTIEDPHVTFLTPDIATIVYHATETPSCGGHSMSGQTNISTVWVRSGGTWKMHLHTEYAVPPK